MGWNCRDWVMECVEIMREGGWVFDDIHQQADLLPAMRRASVLTKEHHRATVVDFDAAPA